MTRTSILFGPPGTGKTTTLLKEVEAALQQGISPDRIAFFAFTRKAANEAVTRAMEMFSLSADDLPWFRTLHSAAFRILGLTSSEVMQEHHYTELSAGLGERFRFQHTYNEDTERVPQGGAMGDLAMGVYSRSRSRCTTIDQEWCALDDQDGNELTLGNARKFARVLDDYKQTYQLLDFSDFLDEVHTPLELDLMIVDEAQDLTKQQWEFARRVGAKAKRIIIAGDDDQAIFQWAGADLRTFLSFKGNLHVLPLSHRLPRKIWECANGIANSIRIRQPKEWAARDDEGQLSYVDAPDRIDLHKGGTWLMLTRLRWQLQMMESICRSQGVVYQMDHTWSNQTPGIRAVVNYEKLRRGETVNGAKLQSMHKFIPGLHEIPRRSEVTWNDITWPFDGIPDWMEAMKGLGFEEMSYIRRLRIKGESLSHPGRVVLSTIHGVKGGEADNVLLLPDTSKRIQSAMRHDPDSEARVWYVGASRARSHLHISRPQTMRHITL